MSSLLPLVVPYILLLGMHFIFKFESDLFSEKIKTRFFWIPLRVADGVVIALCFILPIITLLNGVEFFLQNLITDGVVMCIGGLFMTMCSCFVFARKFFEKIKINKG